MIRNRLGLRARFLMVATAAACWIPCVPAVAAGMPLPQAPSAPRELRATALDANTIYLQWVEPEIDGGSDITEYRIKIFVGGSWIQLGKTTYPDVDYEHSHGGTLLRYHVTAFNGLEGPPSNEVTGTTTGTGTPGAPGAPVNLTAIAAGPTSINLNWDAPLPPAGKTISGYQVNVSRNGGVNFSFLTNTSATETGYRHEGLPVGATLHYEVKALYSDGTLGPPAYANATTVATGIPGAPQNLRATAAGPTVIDVDWDAPASDGGNPITSYEVSVSADGGGSWGTPQTTVLTEYQHRNLAAGATRHYRVRARNASAVGPWTSAVSATTSTGTPPGPPREPDGDRRQFLGDRPELEPPGEWRQQRDHRVSDRAFKHANRRMGGNRGRHGQHAHHLPGHGPLAEHDLLLPGLGDQLLCHGRPLERR